MTKLLITPQEIVERAFSTVENLRDDLINESKIEIAQLRFIKPILGNLYNKIDHDQYVEFVENYLKTPLAYYVKSMVIEDISAQIGSIGAMQMKTTFAVSASDTKQARLCKKALRDADTLMTNAMKYIDENREMFPDYDPVKNPKNIISIKGGIITGKGVK